MNKEYKVEFEIAGPAAMFTRPDSGAAPISYPAPTFSAVRGICDSILRFETAFIVPPFGITNIQQIMEVLKEKDSK